MTAPQPEFLPDGLLAALATLGVPRVDPKRILAGLERTRVKPRPGIGAFLRFAANARRYGFELPRDVRDLLRIADEWALEEAATVNFRYFRVVAQDWELPEAPAGGSLFAELVRRYQWFAFGNMQLWEHFAGLMTLGNDAEDNRYFVATVRDPAPVFWMDHEAERPGLDRHVAPDLATFLRVQFHAPDGVSDRDRSICARPGGKLSRGPRRQLPQSGDGPLVTWPPFLLARSQWLFHAVRYGFDDLQAECKDLPAEAYQFDFDAERPLLGRNEPLALYWLLRSFLLEDGETFARAAEAVDPGLSPLVASARELLARRIQEDPGASNSSAVRLREKLRAVDGPPRRARFTKKNGVERLVSG